MNTFKLLETIFDDCSCPSAYVKCQSIHSEVSSYDDVFKFMSGLVYNDFGGRKVVCALTKHINAIQEIRFGREYSPVMYVRPRMFDKHYRKLQGAAKRSRLASLLRLLKSLNADECWEVNPETHEIRAWWD